MAKRNSSTYRAAAQAHSKVMAAHRELTAQRAQAAQAEEPMHRWPHPIPTAAAPAPAEEAPTTVTTQILEQLACQSQLLVDLLGAVNALTAAVICQKNTT